MDTKTQLHRLREMLAPVLETNAFYRRKLTEAGITHPNDVQTLEDYRQLPFTTKEELSAESGIASTLWYKSHLSARTVHLPTSHFRNNRGTFTMVRYSRIMGLVG